MFNLSSLTIKCYAAIDNYQKINLVDLETLQIIFWLIFLFRTFSTKNIYFFNNQGKNFLRKKLPNLKI